MIDVNGLQFYTLDETLDETFGVRGTPEREQFEQEVALSVERWERRCAKARERSRQWRAKKRAEKEAQACTEACTEACTDSCRGSLPANPVGSPKGSPQANPYSPTWTTWQQQPTITPY